MLMHDMCRMNAWKYPERDAVTAETGESLSWRALDARAERLADALHALGVRQGDKVSCILDNCLEIVVVFFAASRLGAIYSPVNYRFVVREKIQMLEDIAPRVLISKVAYQQEVATIRAEGDLACVLAWPMIDEPGYEAMLAAAPARGMAPAILDDDPVFISYTGGTSGVPKGAMLSHRNLTAAGMNFILTGRIGHDDVYLVLGALFYIALVVPIGYWMAGAKVVIANFEAGRALDLVARHGVTQMLCTGTIFKLTVDEQEARPRDTGSLELVTCGGAPVSQQLVQRAEAALGCGVAQIYGQTEVTLMGTYLYPEEYVAARGAQPDEPAAAANSVGRAAPMVVVRVIGDDWAPLAPGEIGEIAFHGEAVMLGYSKRPALTAETIRDGWLRSGDIGYLDERGFVYLVDRKKDVIISGGENVYSKEVELMLESHPGVSECVVIGVPDDHWGERVHALVIPTPDAASDAEEIRAYCRENLAAYKVPKAIEFRADFPRLATGKIAKQVLREEYWAGEEKRIHGI
jgi:acyl-CoA synthetase (AMP-forming)/AMP-acid ligase II